MNAGLAAYKNQTAVGWSQIDLLLALYDGAIERLEIAIEEMRTKNTRLTQHRLNKAWLIVAQMAAGTSVEDNNTGEDLLKIYDWVLRSIKVGKLSNLEGAVKVLRPLRDAFVQVRDKVAEAERSQAPQVYCEASA